MGRNDDKGAGFDLMMEIFDDQPGGQTPICAQVNEVVAKIQKIEDQVSRQCWTGYLSIYLCNYLYVGCM